MLWIGIIIGTVFIYLIFFNRADGAQMESLKHDGGMDIRYSTLTYLLKEHYPGLRTLNRTKKSITLAVQNGVDTMDFHLLHNFDQLYVRWTVVGPRFGRKSKSWNFDKDMDQHNMFYQIQGYLDTVQ